MKRLPLHILLAVAVVALACAGLQLLLYHYDNRLKAPGPAAHNGYLNLNTWDLARDGMIPLSDGWSFFPGEWVLPGVEPSSRGEERSVGAWPEGLHIGTYRMVIRKTPSESQLMLQGGQMVSAARIYVNGRLVQSIGETGSGTADYAPSNTQVMAFFEDPTELMEIIIHVANYENVAGGMREALLFGTPDQVMAAYLSRSAVLFFVLAACVFLAMYALLIYAYQRWNRQHLFLALICLSSAATLLLHRNHVLALDVPQRVRYALCLFSIIAQVFCTTQFVEAMNWELKKRWATPVLLTAALLFFGLMLLYPEATEALEVCQYLVGTGASANVLGILYRAAVDRKPNSMIFFIGTAAFLVPNALYVSGVMYYEPMFFTTPVVYGTLLFIAIYAVELNRSYARIFAKTLDANENLERIVNERTAEMLATNQRLKMAEHARREMVGSISHDLRAPLTSIRGHVELLLEEIPEEERRRCLELIHNRTVSMERLVQDLYLFSSLEAKSLTFNFQRIPLVPFLEETYFNFQADAQFAKLELTMEAPDSERKVEIDPDRLGQVFSNLYFNALRYTPDGGSIALTLELAGGEAIISVEDTGRGILAEDLPHIFDRFYKASKARGVQEGGSGLGLAIASSIVEQHGGRIWAESDYGKGARITFTLPLLP